ncbi:MBL fold metallo-hydrolase [Glaciihabitans sp. INWT7]|uniref:MBL fold metallo-hydrolase n=1 Tax=Glaciihabitans sp. INWT7 TaxID=2596912 RepID=UPI0016264890|nr:MBL fold metallo-hydrolase [Glaciihabitans sp. INWT7]QNE46676.1 MBL fold metallo-hydrolase [Glaciihabitans sp. INWT7]
MLTRIAKAVFVHESSFCQSNTVVVQGDAGVLVIDAGVFESELLCLAKDLSELGHIVVAGFSTHPHWDHLLWHSALGTATRYGTAGCAATAEDRLSGGVQAAAKAAGIPEHVPLELLGHITGLPAGAVQIPWDGPRVRIIEHRAHAPGHAALVIDEARVLVAGDMLSDVLIPMLDLNGPDDPIGDYLTALEVIEAEARDAVVVVPGHGSVGGVGQMRARIDRDRDYVHALREDQEPLDPRVGPSAQPGWEWVSDVHSGQLRRLAQHGPAQHGPAQHDPAQHDPA